MCALDSMEKDTRSDIDMNNLLTENIKFQVGQGPVKSVFRPKERYFYKQRPISAKNYHPRPKSGRRYNKRYSYPTPRKTVFKNNGSYKYRPRPSTPKNHFPIPKNGERYVWQTNHIPKKVSKNPYKRRSVFKPKQRYSYICVVEEKNTTNAEGIRYVFPAPKKSVFKKYSHYKYNPRPASPKNYSPKAKAANRYVCQIKKVTSDITLNKSTAKTNKAMFRKLMLLNRLNAKKDLDHEDNIPLQKIDEDMTDASANTDDSVEDKTEASAIAEVIDEDNTEASANAEVIDEDKTEASANSEDSLQKTKCEASGARAGAGTDEDHSNESSQPVKNDEPEVTDMSEDITANKIVKVVMEKAQDQGQTNQKNEINIKDKESEKKRKIPETETGEKRAQESKLNESTSKENEELLEKEEVAESKGLWFNPELRKKIHVTAKGWELRGAA